MKSIIKARQAILDDLKSRYAAKDPNVFASDLSKHRPGMINCFFGQGRLRCPVCKDGELMYSRARSNLHVHARCSTPTCVRWME